MSHFTVLVVGEDAEAQLQPYHEFECTGTRDQYVIPVDITADVQEQIDDADGSLVEGLEYYGLEDKIIDRESEAFRENMNNFEYGYAVVKDGKLIKAVKFTNPNAHWDWYVLGGRWTGCFPLKEGAGGIVGKPGLMTETSKEGYVDSAQKGDIDFDRARNESGEEARVSWKKAHALIADKAIPVSWDVIRAAHPGNLDMAREVYNTQEAVVAFGSTREFGFFDKVEDFLVTEEEYVSAARARALVTFAVVKGGKWYQKGDMGWWGLVSNEEDQRVWNAKFHEMIAALPDSTILSVYDCHI